MVFSHTSNSFSVTELTLRVYVPAAKVALYRTIHSGGLAQSSEDAVCTGQGLP